MQQTLAEYLYENWQANIVDHALRVYVDSNGQTCFYIHPDLIDGETLDFVVEENEVRLTDSKVIDADLVTEAG